ncbi:regulator of hemoglobinization and erythroid cell expansion protein [Carettochelys insculpta]|uniref:regulator of hemoglobinization and erythroid cell expansion protein n=1 Tax=Carettochelys insculpta TaxID=44489 RepID=UPI003EB7C2F3
MTCSDVYWWINILVSAVSSALYILLLVGLYIKLSRKIDRHCCSNQASSKPSTKREQPNISQAGKEDLRRSSIQGDSDTSSDSSECFDQSPPTRQGPQSEEGINYTSLVFQATGQNTSNTGDYENMKMGADYVNVDPQNRKLDFWTCSSPVSSKPVDYTEVKL